MFRRQLLIFRTLKHVPSFRTNLTQAKQAELKWDIVVGVCLERKPTISRPLRKIEEEFMQMLRQIEDENSMKSDFELRLAIDERRAAEFKRGNVSLEEMEAAIGETAIEFEDRCTNEFAEFQPAPRSTEADETNDMKSTNRKLDKHLLFLSYEKIGDKEQWILPYGHLLDDESLLQAAQRILKEQCGRKVKATFYGNAPSGFYKYRYPNVVKESTNIDGRKTFFMKAHYLGGDIEEYEKRKDFCWASRDELSGRLQNSYHKAIRPFLMDDEEV